MKTQTEISGKNVLLIVALAFNALLGYTAWTASHEAAALRGEIEGIREISQPKITVPVIFEC